MHSIGQERVGWRNLTKDGQLLARIKLNNYPFSRIGPLHGASDSSGHIQGVSHGATFYSPFWKSLLCNRMPSHNASHSIMV